MKNDCIKINKATEEDIDNLTCIYNDSIKIFPSDVRKDSDKNLFCEFYNKNNVFIVERTDNSKKIEWVAFRINQNKVIIAGLYLLIDEQRKGIGTKILNYCFDTLWNNKYKIVTLYALKNASWSIEFYKKNGFYIYDPTIELENDLDLLKFEKINNWELLMYKKI